MDFLTPPCSVQTNHTRTPRGERNDAQYGAALTCPPSRASWARCDRIVGAALLVTLLVVVAGALS